MKCKSMESSCLGEPPGFHLLVNVKLELKIKFWFIHITGLEHTTASHLQHDPAS